MKKKMSDGCKAKKFHKTEQLHTREAIIKMKISKTGKNIGSENPNSKKVICINENGEKTVYGSMAEAVKETGSNINGIVACCKGKNNKCNGFRWKYFEDYMALI